MSTPDELEERERDREDYLLAFYELTKDEPLRWSTHRAIAERAALPEGRIFTIGQDLVGQGQVEFRTMGGVDGYVELTPAGVTAAERLIRDRGPAPSPGWAAPPQSDPEADRTWVQTYLPMLRLAFESYRKEGDWPDIDDLQRALDREQQDVDVRQALQQRPRLPGERRLLFSTNFFVPLQMLRFLPEAGPAIDRCIDLVRRAVALYFSDSDRLVLSSDDPDLALSYSDDTTPTAARLLLHDFPSPFAGGGYGEQGSWTLSINGSTARRFRDVASVDDYFEVQDHLRRESQAQLAALAGPLESETPDSQPARADMVQARGQVSIFVVMPFGEEWSTGVYDFIRRAVRSLGFADGVVVRADEITRPGRIDQQILEAITAADAVVGDITGANPNVMWELGYAEAANVPSVVLNQHIEDSPFDLANTRQVRYRLAPTDDDEEALAAHIRAALDEGRSRSAGSW